MPRSRTVAVEVYRSVERLAPEWDELADRAGAPPFLRPGWVGAWWRAFGRGEPEILAVRDDGRLAAVLPLSRNKDVLRSMTDDDGVESGLLADSDEALDELTHDLVRRCGYRASLLFVDPARPGLATLRRVAADARSRLLVRTVGQCPYIAIGEWETYDTRVDAKIKADLRRRRRRLDEQGEVSVDFDGSERQFDRLLEDAFALEASGWKGEQGTAIVSRWGARQFYTEVARWGRARGLLHLAFLRIDGRPVAFEYALRERGTHYRLKIGFDAAYHEFSPGKQLLSATIEDACRAGCSRFDFLGGADEYKLEWATGLRDLVLVQLFSRRAAGWVAHAAFGAGPAVADRARRFRRRR